MPSLRAYTPEELKEAIISALETYGAAKETTLSSINVKVATETTLSSVDGRLGSIDGKTPSLTPAGNRPISISEDVIGLLKEATFTGRLPVALQQDADGAIYLVLKTDLVGLGKETTLAGRITKNDLIDALAIGVKPETDYNSTTTADTAFINIVPPSGEYVYLMCITGNVGTDGDVIELQALDVDGVTWHIVDRLKMIANTSMVKGYPNLKLDVIKVAGVEKSIMAGDGTTATVRLLSRGTGPWEASIQYFCAP